MPCLQLFNQLSAVNKALHDLGVAGILYDNPAIQALYRMRGELLGATGVTFPRKQALIKAIIGLSPGSIRVWFDNETGWMVEARESPGAHPSYHQIDAQTAGILAGPDPPADLVHSFMREDEFVGN